MFNSNSLQAQLCAVNVVVNGETCLNPGAPCGNGGTCTNVAILKKACLCVGHKSPGWWKKWKNGWDILTTSSSSTTFQVSNAPENFNLLYFHTLDIPTYGDSLIVPFQQGGYTLLTSLSIDPNVLNWELTNLSYSIDPFMLGTSNTGQNIVSMHPTIPSSGTIDLTTGEVLGFWATILVNDIYDTNNPIVRLADVTGYYDSIEETIEFFFQGNWNIPDISDVPGCVDSMACNYDSLATTDDGSCEFFTCAGCTDSGACNFDPGATLDDGSCEYVSCIYPPANDDCWSSEAVMCGTSVAGTTLLSNDNEGLIGSTCGTDIDGPGVWYVVMGDGNQIIVETCNTTSGYDTRISLFEGYCGNLTCIGGNDDSCPGLLSSISHTTTIGVDVYILVHGSGGSTGDFQLDISCSFDVPGCTDATACNYNSSATLDDGSCDYSCHGCMDSQACNYDSLATIDNTTCCYDECVTLTLSDSSGNGCYGLSWEIYDGASYSIFDIDFLCEPVIICLDNGCYNMNIGGSSNDSEISWTLSSGENVLASGGAPESNVFFSVGSGTCYYCNNPMACNYESDPQDIPLPDMQLCEYSSCAGCTYSEAANYDASKTLDDGSCNFDLVNPCPADFTGDCWVNTADLLVFLGDFGMWCDDCWD